MVENFIDLGCLDFRLANADGTWATNNLYSSREDAFRAKGRENVPNAHIVELDTRLEVGKVCELLADEKSVWDEYLSVADSMNPESYKRKWPDGYRWIAVYVVTGGSEGMYLHVDVIYQGGARELVLLGKTLTNWRPELWESAGRIARRLGA